MGDIGGQVLGGGQKQTQDVQVDPTTQALNDAKLAQLSELFSVAPLYSFGQPQPSIYTPSSDVSQLYSGAAGGADLSNLLSFDDYKNLGLDATGNYISQIATPEILSQASLAGLEGGGYVPEALAKATAQIGLPFVQGLPGASTALTLAGPQANLLGAQRAQTLFPLADYGRALQESDLLRRQGVVTSGLTGIPFTPETSTKTKQSSQPLFNFFGQG